MVFVIGTFEFAASALRTLRVCFEFAAHALKTVRISCFEFHQLNAEILLALTSANKLWDRTLSSPYRFLCRQTPPFQPLPGL